MELSELIEPVEVVIVDPFRVLDECLLAAFGDLEVGAACGR